MAAADNRLPEPARSIAVAAAQTVAAARIRDRAAFDDGVARLAALDRERIGRVLGGVVRMLLEETHQDGLTGDDARAVLEHCVRSAVVWWPEVDGAVLVVVLTGALGVHEPDEEAPPVGDRALAAHSTLLIADLLDGVGRPLAGYLDIAFGDIRRDEIMEQP
jgi:hypothetical protein